MKKVTGLGGIFFKCNDVQKMKDWYSKNLGLADEGWGASFEWRQADDPTKTGTTAWSPFPKDTKYFEPSKKEFMINYMVENIDELVEQLKSEGVTIIDEVEESDYGKFVHILDLEGNKIELWEPADEE